MMYHPLHVGSTGHPTSAHQDCQQLLCDPTIGALPSILTCYSTNMISHTGRPTTKTGRIGYNISSSLVYSCSTPQRSSASLRMGEPPLGNLGEARLLISPSSTPLKSMHAEPVYPCYVDIAAADYARSYLLLSLRSRRHTAPTSGH